MYFSTKVWSSKTSSSWSRGHQHGCWGFLEKSGGMQWNVIWMLTDPTARISHEDSLLQVSMNMSSAMSLPSRFNNGLLFSLSLMMLSRRTEKKEFLLSSSWILPRLSHSSLDAVMRWNYETLASAILRVCLHTAHTDVLASCHLILIGQLQRQKYSTSRLTEIRWEIRCGKGEMRGGQIRWGKKRWGVDGVMI